MITDLNNLEPLLGQYELGLILVGPVLSFSIGGHRYFHVTANGSKMYETIGLGTFDNEVDAKTQRDNIIAILKGRFAKMQIFDSHYDMARAVNDRWPNEETARILAFAALLTEPETGKAAQGGSIGEDSDAQIVPSGHGTERADDEAREPVDLANDATPPSAPPPMFEVAEPAQSLPPSHMSADAPSPLDSAVQLTTAQQQHPGGNDDILGISLSEVALRSPNQSQGAVELSAPSTGSAPSVDRPPRVQQDYSRRNEDDLASIRRALSPSRQSQTSPQPPAVAARSPSSLDSPVTERRGHSERRDDLLMTMASFTRPDIYQKDFAARSKALDPSDRTQKAPRLMGVRNLVSLLVLMGAVGGASAFITWAMLRSITPRVTDEVGTIAARQPAAVPTPS